MLSGVAKTIMLPTVSRLKLASVFATHFDSSVTREDITNHLSKTLNIKPDALIVDKLTTKHSSYSSFHVSCYCIDPSVFFDPVIWPEGCLFRRWRTAPQGQTGRSTQRQLLTESQQQLGQRAPGA